MTLTIDLPDELEAALKQKAREEGLSLTAYTQRVLEERLSEPAVAAHASTRTPISQVIEDIMKDTPPNELAKLPKDGASEHDHYIHGWQKRNS